MTNENIIMFHSCLCLSLVVRGVLFRFVFDKKHTKTKFEKVSSAVSIIMRVLVAVPTIVQAINVALEWDSFHRGNVNHTLRYRNLVGENITDAQSLEQWPNKLMFVRHGESYSNAHVQDVRDCLLTAKGVTQCKALNTDVSTKYLPPDLIVSSPMFRTIQTTYYGFHNWISAGVPVRFLFCNILDSVIFEVSRTIVARGIMIENKHNFTLKNCSLSRGSILGSVCSPSNSLQVMLSSDVRETHLITKPITIGFQQNWGSPTSDWRLKEDPVVYNFVSGLENFGFENANARATWDRSENTFWESKKQVSDFKGRVNRFFSWIAGGGCERISGKAKCERIAVVSHQTQIVKGFHEKGSKAPALDNAQYWFRGGPQGVAMKHKMQQNKP